MTVTISCGFPPVQALSGDVWISGNAHMDLPHSGVFPIHLN
jgi:hypothetical protein